jgi:hypothetical protein
MKVNPNMHSHDRTLLAKLGFADPDKGSDLHDLACQYLAQPEVAVKVFNATNSKWWRIFEIRQFDVDMPQCSFSKEYFWACQFKVANTSISNVRFKKAEFEVHIAKGEGQYRSTIGFMDLRNQYEVSIRFEGKRGVFLTKDWECKSVAKSWVEDPASQIATIHSEVPIEVKISNTNAGDILRQIQLYREYVLAGSEIRDRNRPWSIPSGYAQNFVVATAFPLSAGDVAMLNSAGITHVQLGDGFKAFAEAARAARQNGGPGNSLVL